MADPTFIQTPGPFAGVAAKVKAAGTNIKNAVLGRTPVPKEVQMYDPFANAAQTTSSTTEAFLSARGTFYRVTISPKAGAGMYAVEELMRNPTVSDLVDENKQPTQGLGRESPILITGVEVSQSDIVSATPCLNNAKVFYVFGQNFGNIMITGEIFLGTLGDPVYDGFERLTEFFHKYRVSERKLPLSVSIAKMAYYFYLTGLRISAIDPEYHTMPFALVGTLLDISREEISLINPKSMVLTSKSLEDPSIVAALQRRRALSYDQDLEGITPSKTVQDLLAAPANELGNAGAVPDKGAQTIQKAVNTDKKTQDQLDSEAAQKAAAEAAKKLKGATKAGRLARNAAISKPYQEWQNAVKPMFGPGNSAPSFNYGSWWESLKHASQAGKAAEAASYKAAADANTATLNAVVPPEGE